MLGMLSCLLLLGMYGAQGLEPRPSTHYRVIYTSSQAPPPIGPYNQANIPLSLSIKLYVFSKSVRFDHKSILP